jgi:hypothetical protein
MGRAVFTLSPVDTWVAGGHGCLAHFTGAGWDPPFDISVDAYQPLEAVWGSTADDVWAVGGRSSSPGMLLHFDGTGWTRETFGDSGFVDVWGSATDDVWAVTAAGAIAHFDGAAWSWAVEDTGVSGVQQLWGSSASDVWLVGACESWRFDGVSWAAGPTHGCGTLQAVGGTGTETFGVGVGGDIYQLVADDWVQTTSPTPNTLNDVVFVGPDDGWAVGLFGTILRYNGVAWATVEGGGVGELVRVWGTGPDDVWALDTVGGILHWDGSAWAVSESGAHAALNGIWGSGAGDIWAVGTWGAILRRRAEAA